MLVHVSHTTVCPNLIAQRVRRTKPHSIISHITYLSEQHFIDVAQAAIYFNLFKNIKKNK